MDIDIVLETTDAQLPPLPAGSMRYVVAENGVFLERHTELYRTSARVDDWVAGLAAHREGCDLLCPEIPGEMVASMLTFFRWAFELHGGEAALVLLFDVLNKRFVWYCPEQRVRMWESWSGKWYTASDIKYTDPTELPPGHVVFGDAHSHGDLAAYASATDQRDEEFKDGLHIIAGHVDSDRPSFWIDFVMDGQRFGIMPDEFFGPVEPCEPPPVPFEWQDQVIIDKDPYRYARSKTDERSRDGTRNTYSK